MTLITKRDMLLRAAGVLFLGALSFAIWHVLDSETSKHGATPPERWTDAEPPAASVTIAGYEPALLVSWAEHGVVPADVRLPAHYSNPTSILEAKTTGETTASALYQVWKLLDKEQRYKILDVVTNSENPAWITALIFDIVYHGTASETDPFMADRIRGATVSVAYLQAKMGIWLLDHIAQHAIHPKVRSNAAVDASEIRARVRRLGR